MVRKILISISAAILLSSCYSRPPTWAKGNPNMLLAVSELRTAADNAEDHSQTWDVSKKPLNGRPWLLANRADRFRIEMAEEQGLTKDDAIELLDSLIGKGEQALRTEFAGLENQPAVQDELDSVQLAERQHLENLQAPDELHEWANELADALPGVEPHPGGALRILETLPAVPFIYGWIWNHAAHEWRGPNWHDFNQQRIYMPDLASDDTVLNELANANDTELLALYAPIVVQEIGVPETPDFRDDLLGRGELIPNREGDPIAHIDTTKPTVYGYVSEAYLGEAWHKQINYSLWYHDHPELKPRDPEAGNIEGELIRITLDEKNQPLLSEAVYACGCYHRIYPINTLEEAAKDQFGGPVTGEYSLGNRNTHKIDGIIPELGGKFDRNQPHPIVFVRSGFHLPAIVQFADYLPSGNEQMKYTFLPESELESLPWGTETVSFFDRDGLVRGSDRPEAWMMYPSGIYHAGTPRIRGIHKIHFDQYDYNDPTLLSELLRIPTNQGVLKDVASYHNDGNVDSSIGLLGQVQR